MNDGRYFIAKGKHLVVPVTKQEYDDYWNKKRKEPKTNEELFCQLPTEEKAKVFIAICRDAFKAENYRRNHWSELQTIEYWKKWLKQPYKEEDEK